MACFQGPHIQWGHLWGSASTGKNAGEVALKRIPNQGIEHQRHDYATLNPLAPLVGDFKFSPGSDGNGS